MQLFHYSASRPISPTTSLYHLTWQKANLLVLLCHLHHLHHLYAIGKITHWYDKNKMTKETLHTVIQYKYKRYEKWACFHLIFCTKCKWCFGNPEFILLLLDMRFRYLDGNNNNVIVFTTVPWCWRTLETFGQDWCTTLTNTNKQVSDWQIKQKI